MNSPVVSCDLYGVMIVTVYGTVLQSVVSGLGIKRIMQLPPAANNEILRSRSGLLRIVIVAF